jgi:CheY-like chemotaxis protein
MQFLPEIQDQNLGLNDSEAAIVASSILIVDDQAAHVLLLERLLQDAGYVNVSSTMDPCEVGALHRKHPYDLILLDVQMPGLDGFGVMDGLRADLVSNLLPVIVLTAQPGHKLRALQAGARDFINKPFETVEVKVRIHRMLEVSLLHKRLHAHNRDLERTVRERTAALQESEARYRSLTELAVDWYWEQNDAGQLTRASGLVMELLGITDVDDWDPAERETLEDNIKARRPFLDLIMHRRRTDGSRQQFRISGEPMFDGACRFTGYRGLGVEVLTNQ